MGGAEATNTTSFTRIKSYLTKNYVGITLLLSFFLSLFLSSFYVIGVAVKGNFAVSGGSDAYYNMRIIQYILATHHQLLYDPLLNYPIGLENPRPPFFHWLAVLLGYAFSPFLGGVYKSTMTMFLLETAIGGAFIVFPTYLLGKEVFNKKVGLIGAILAALSPLTLMKSIASIGLFDIFTALFAIMMIYFFLKSVDTFKEVEGSNLRARFVNSVKANRISILYSILGGISLTASMLTWVGTISVALIIVGVGVIQLIINTIRRKSNLSFLISSLFYSVGFILALPWYYETGFLFRWTPVFLVWLLLIITSLFVIIMERRPWIVTIGSYALLLAAAIVIIYFKDNTLLQNIISGQHYFIKNKIYDTIAEAQALPLGEDIMEFDPFMFFASLVAIGVLIYKWLKSKDFKTTLILFYSAGIIFISMIASKFLYFGASATGILTAYIIVEGFRRLGWQESLDKVKGRGTSKASLKEMRFSQIVVILMVIFLLIVPATFYALDSGIPYNNKTQYDREIYNATPSFLRPQNYTPPYYLGAFGVSLDLPNSPWVRALDWFKNQDAQYPPNERPAFISWWDYGFQTLEQGQHPVMADNFQDGIYPAAQILMAQNESEIISVMIARIIDYFNQFNQLNNSTLKSILVQYFGIQGYQKIINYELNGPNYIPDIYANKSYYGPYEDIQPGDAKYILIEHYLTNTFNLSTLINAYQSLEQQTGFYMSYIAVDYRLFPFSGIDTGIFYAPAYLGDFQYINVQGEIVPIDFYNITVTDINGNTYPLQDFPPGDTAVSYNINYQPMFYNSTIYRVFIGYPPSVVGANNSIPGISSNLRYYYPMQAWGMPNFELVYKTVFWNPYKDYQNHSNAWQPVSLQQGYYYLTHHIGTVDLNPPASSVLPSDVVFVEYYPGAIIQGRVTDSSGMPIAGIRVTIDDQYGIPHETVLTNSSGYYQLYAVAGNDTIVVSTGSYNSLFMVGKNILETYNITISQSQADRTAYSNTGEPLWIVNKNFQISSHSLAGTVFYNLAGISSFVPNTDVPANATLRFFNSSENYTLTVKTGLNGSYYIPDIPPYEYNVSANVDGHWYYNVANVSINSNSTSKDIAIPYSKININFINKFQANGLNHLQITRGNFTQILNISGSNYKIILPIGIFNISAENGPYRFSTILNLENKGNLTLNVTYEKYYYLNITQGVNYKIVSASYQDILNNSYSGEFNLMNNTFSAYLPPSIYLVSLTSIRSGIYYINETTVNLNNSLSIKPRFTEASMVTVTVFNGNRTQPGVPVEFMGNGIMLQFTTNSTGQFKAYLPYGTYSVTAYFNYNSSIYVSNGLYSIFSPNYNLQIFPGPGHTVTGHITSQNSGIILAYSSGIPIYYDVLTRGQKYIIYLPNGTNVNTVTFRSLGMNYEVEGLNISTSSSPVNVTFLIQSNYNYVYYIHLKGPENYNITASKSEVQTYIQPGSYEVYLTGDGIIPVSNVTSISILPVYNGQVIKLPVNVYVKFEVNTKGNVEIFRNGQLVSELLNSTLTPGTYSIYSNYYYTSNITTMNITRNSTFTPNLVQSYFLNIVNRVSGITYISNGTNIISTSTGIYLPAGYYYIYSFNRINTSYEYFGSASVNIPSQQTVYLNSSLVKLMGNIKFNSINSTFNSGFVQIQPLNYTVPFNSYVELPYGNYSIYAVSGKYAYIGTISVNTKSENITLNMARAYSLIYGTFIGSSAYTNEIYIDMGTRFYVKAFGTINLPNGSYLFQGSTILMNYGRQNNYVLKQEVNVSGPTYTTLEFQIVKNVAVKIFPMGGQLTGLPGHNVSFPIQIISNSNIPISFTLTNSSTFNVYNQYLNLTPYSMGIINATIGVPKGQPAGTYQIGMNLQYLGIYHYISVNVTVPNIISLNITVNNNTGSVFRNTIYYELNIKNTGNSKLNVTILVLNNVSLKQEGINVSVNNRPYSNISLYPNQFNQSNIGLSFQSGVFNINTPIVIEIKYGNQSLLYNLYPSIPGLEFKTIQAKGYGIQNYSALIQYSYMAGVIIFVVVLIVAIMISVRRRNRA